MSDVGTSRGTRARLVAWAPVHRRPAFRTLLALAAVALSLLAVVPGAGAKNCGKEIIDEYFFTGRLKYHSQECYASALKQVDPDARMYSGILGAIRAARARDKARDNAAANPVTTATDGGDAATTVDPTDPVPVTPTGTAPETQAAPLDTAIPTLPPEPASAPAIPATQAAAIERAADSGVPLSVVVLAGLAALLTVVGLAGVLVRRIERGY